MLRRVALAAGVGLALIVGSCTVAFAIAGGRVTHGFPWVVQVRALSDGTYGTGVQISARWVLTARRVAPNGHLRGYISYSNNVYRPRGEHRPVRIDRVAVAPHGDIELRHLAKPARLHHCAPLGLDYRIHQHGVATIMGFGGNSHGNPSKHLRRARVRLTGLNHDGYHGITQKALAKSGRAQGGDYGGPMIVHGRVIGLGSIIYGKPERMLYSLLSQDKRWLKTRKPR